MANFKIVPTKANLIKTKENLDFAKKGYELLDKKRTVLIKEMMDLNARASELQKTIEEEFSRVYELLQDSTITLGTYQLDEMSKSIKAEEDFDIKFKSVMGVELPEIYHKNPAVKTQYGLYGTNETFDKAAIQMTRIREIIYELAEVENSVFRLAIELKKSVKRANALDKIQIPKYNDTIREIEEILEEKEREDFFRLKKVKNKKK